MNTYIYNHTLLPNMMRDFTGKKDTVNPATMLLSFSTSFYVAFFMFGIWVHNYSKTKFYEKSRPPWSVTEEDRRKTQWKANSYREISMGDDFTVLPLTAIGTERKWPERDFLFLFWCKKWAQ